MPHKISTLQARQGKAAEEEDIENTQTYNRIGVPLKPYYVRCLISGDAPR
jgi:hypothetical protein